MADFLLTVALPVGLALSLASLVHCVIARKGTAWFMVIVLLGPLGWIFHLGACMGWFKFGSSQPGSVEQTPTSSRRCPRCQQPAATLHGFDDGRLTILMCQMCKSEMEFRRSGFSLPE